MLSSRPCLVCVFLLRSVLLSSLSVLISLLLSLPSYPSLYSFLPSNSEFTMLSSVSSSVSLSSPSPLSLYLSLCPSPTLRLRLCILSCLYLCICLSPLSPSPSPSLCLSCHSLIPTAEPNAASLHVSNHASLFVSVSAVTAG